MSGRRGPRHPTIPRRQAATHLRDDYSFAGLLRFSLMFVLIWWAWLGHTTFSTRFDTDDAVQRALTAVLSSSFRPAGASPP